MNDCRNIEKDLSALIDGELPGERQAEVIAHVDHCPQCSQRVAELQKLVTGIAALPAEPMPPQFLADVRRKLRPSKTTWVDTWFRPVWWKVPLEALAVLALLAGVFALLPPTQLKAPVVARTRSAPEKPGVTARILESEPVIAAKEFALETQLPPRTNTELVAKWDEDLTAIQTQQSRFVVDGGNRITMVKSGENWQVVRIERNPDLPGRVAAPAASALPKLPETLVVRGDSVVAVRLRVENLAKELNGHVDVHEFSKTFIVSLPKSKVKAFRERVTSKDNQVSYAAPKPAEPEPEVGVVVIVEP